MDSCLLRFVALVIICSLEKVCCSQCDATFYNPVADCSLHPLRVGYYPSPICGSLHVLTDADGRPNAEFARLGYHPGTDSYYHEYSAGRYLSIALTKRARIYAIAVEGSPRNLRYYLKSMEIWYKVSVNDFNVTRGSVVFEDFYKENGIRKRFIANMINRTKFEFANPFFADEVRIHPITFDGDKVFRVELYGCYLGRVTVPASIGINNPTTIFMDKSQDASLAKYRYYLKINEPNGTEIIQDMNRTVMYTFISHGKGIVELGLNYSTGWLSTDKLEAVIQGPIYGLKLTLDSSEVSPYVKQESLAIEFYVGTSVQHYQLKRYHFSFGDGSSLTHNYCKHQYARGVYNAVATASNDFFSTNLTRSVVICPKTSPGVSYHPYRSSAFRVEYLGPAAVYNLTVTFYALQNVFFNFSVNFTQVQTGAAYAVGYVVKKVTLANPVTAPSTQHFRFQYHDACRRYDSHDVNVFVDERAAGVSLKLNQTFKSSLIDPVPYYFKNYPIDFYIDVKNGTTVSCYVHSGASASVLVADRYFKATRTYASGSRVSVYARCSNRLQVTARSSSITIDLKEVPEAMTNFSLELPTKIVRVGQSFHLLIAFVNGNEMTCNITSITDGTSITYLYSQLVARQESHNSVGKAYRITLSTSVFSLAHQLDVVCRNVRNEVKGSVTFQAEEPVTNLGLSLPKLLCFNETLPVRITTSQGRPLLSSLYINGTKHLEYYSQNGSFNVFRVQRVMYGEPGWKEIVIRAGNNISAAEKSARLRVARNITGLSLLVNFTISSNQALERRPANLLPINETVNFTASVIPRAEGYSYRWSINGNMSVVFENTSYWQYAFDTSGKHLLELEVFGCNNFTYRQYFTVLEPVKDFLVTIRPYPVVLVAAPFSVSVAITSNSDCIVGYFGQANTTITRCRNDSLNGTFCDFSSAVCNKVTSFLVSGNYSVKITSSNGLYARLKAYNLVAKSCKSPTITVQGKSIDSKAGKLVAQVYRSNPVMYQVTSVNISCELAHTYALHWVVYSPWNGAKYSQLVPNVDFNIANNNRTLTLPCCTLSYGQFNVKVTVRMAGHDLIDGKFDTTELITGYVNDTDLVPNLKESSGNYSYAYNTTISLNAEDSYDPDKFTKSLSFTWYCRDIVLEPRDIVSLPNIPVINSSYFVQKINASLPLNTSLAHHSISGVSSRVLVNGSFESLKNYTDDASSKVMLGCFGKPFGRLDVSNATASISFNSAYLQENHTIEFLVVVESATPLRLRSSTARRKIYVRSRETPYFEIRCIENCASKVAPAEKLTLRVICKSDSCERRASFIWSMLENGRSVSLADKIYSQPTDRDLYMKPNAVSIGSHCRLTLRGTAHDGAIFQRTYEFIVNKAPESGNCTLSPLSGIAIQTNFKINCTGWTDSEQPISYEVAHYTKTLTTISCKTTKGSCDTIFPVGHGKNSSLNVRVRVIDALSMYKDFFFVVEVIAGKLTLEEMDKYLNIIKNGTNREKTTQLISAVTSVLNVDKNLKSRKHLKKSIELREASTLRLAEMVSLDTISTVAPITAAVADVPSQFSQEAGNKATNAIVQMTGFFSANKAGYVFRDIVDQGKSILNAIGMVSRCTSMNLDPNKIRQNQTNSTEEEYLLWTKDVGRQVIINATSAFENVTDAMLSRMSPYDEQISLPTSDLALVLKKSFAAELNKTSKLSVMNNNVVIPSLEDLRVDNSYAVISLLMKVTTFNPYFWGTSSKRISSTMTDLEFRAGNSPLVVKNAKEPIKFQIRREVKQPIPFQHWKLQQRPNQERVNYHKFILNYDSSLHLEFKPTNYCMNYNIYIKYGSRPSRDDYLKNWTLPDLKTCNNTGHQEELRANICAIYREVVESSLRHQGNGSEEIINCTLRATLQERIREALTPCTLDPYKAYLLDSETKNGAYYVGIYEAERRILQEAVPALLYNSSNDCQIADSTGQSSYFVRGYTAKCRYWAPTGEEQWMSDGCYVEKETDPSTVHCRCNHLTTFAADFLISPNPIDIDRVIEGFKNIEDNLSVLIFTSLILAVYIILLVYLRRKDKRDAGKLNVTVIDDDSSKPYEYLVLLVTGARINAGSTAHVFCCLNSESLVGKPKLLLGSERRPFQRDQIDAFKISFSKPLGDITDIRIWHDNSGDSPGWYLSRIYVEDLQSSKRVMFICEQWLAVELDDGRIDRVIPAANCDDKKLFTHLFTTKAAKDLSDQHLWLSVALKRPHDTFTRAQRLTCCMSLLLTTMLASAMFFQLGNNSKYLWKVGSLVIDYKGIIIGIQSGLVVIPINFAIVWSFRHTESFEHYRKRCENRKAGLSTRRSMLLPCGFLIIAWFLALASILASFVVVLFYSMQWGNDKSQQFVLSVFTSFVQSAFLIQPLKLVFVAMIIAAILKTTDDDTDVLDSYRYCAQEREVTQVQPEVDVSKLQTSPLTDDQLKHARKRRHMEIQLKVFLQDLMSYLVFLTFLALVVRGYRDPDEYYFRKALEDDIVHHHFKSIQDVPGVWTWVQQHFIPAIYTQQWYNGNNFTNFKMLQNQEAYRIGLARIRQIRIRPGSCKVWEDMARYFNTCDDVYSLSINEERSFDVGWRNMSTRKRRSTVERGWDQIDLLEMEPKAVFRNDAFVRMQNYSGNIPRTSVDEIFNKQINSTVDFNELNESNGSRAILKRSRRALKFKIRRKTIQILSVLKHPDIVSIDEQYLLPNGKIKPNKQHWLYNDMSSLRGFPYYGHFATYSGGGYVASLSTDIDFARATAMALEQDSWVDMLTRALFFEFSVYNANMNFFATGFVIIEILPTGSVVPNANIRVFKLYRYVGTFGRLVMASEIILLLCLLFFIYKECRHMYRLGWGYFKLFWSWIEITIAVALFTALILRAFSWYEGDKNLIALHTNMEQFINFHYTVVADDALLLTITIICFASTLKLIKLLNIFPTFMSLKETIHRSVGPMVNYFLPFCIAFFGFASLAHLLFHSEMLFSSYIDSCQTQLLMLIGGSVYYTLRRAHSILGPLFFFMFAAFETCILLNIFLSIINESIKDSAYWKAQSRSKEFVDFIEDRVRAIFNLKPAVKNQNPAYCSRKSAVHPQNATKSSMQKDAAACESTVMNSLPRKISNYNRAVQQTSIHRSSILGLLHRKGRSESRSHSYIGSRQSGKTNVAVTCAANDNRSRNVARKGHKDEIELLIEDVWIQRHTEKLFEQWKEILERLDNFIEDSIEDDVIDLKMDLVVYCMC